MADITVKIKGPDIASAIQKSIDKIIAHSEIALDSVAEATKNDARAECPVDTGLLRSDIEVYKVPLLRQIGNNVFYGVYVHNGTYKMKARPYLFNSFEKNRQGFIRDIRSMKV